MMMRPEQVDQCNQVLVTNSAIFFSGLEKEDNLATKCTQEPSCGLLEKRRYFFFFKPLAMQPCAPSQNKC